MQKKLFIRLSALFAATLLAPSAFGWQPVTNGLPASLSVSRIASSGELALLNASSGSPNGVHATTNGGTSWFKTATLPGSTQNANSLLVVSNTFYVVRTGQAIGTNIVMYSTNYGASWMGATNIPNSTPLHLIASDGSALFAGATATGPFNVWRSTNGGAGWELVGTGSANFGNGTLRALGGQSGRMVAAYNTGIYTLTGSGTNWIKISTDGNVIANTRMAWETDRLFMLNGETSRRALALLDGGTNVISVTNGLPEGLLSFSPYTTYSDITALPGAAFICAATYISAYQTHLLSSKDGGTNWISQPVPSGSTTVNAIEAINSNLFAAFNAYPGLFRAAILNGELIFAPVITSHPASTAVVPGGNITFTADITSAVPMNLQWSKNGAAMAGETNLTLTLTGVTTNDTGSFTLAAWNLAGTNTTTPATLTIIPPTPGHLNLAFSAGVFGYEFVGTTNGGGTVSFVKAFTNNQVIIAGSFSHVNMTLNAAGQVSGGVRSQKIARMNPDGSADTSFLTAPGFGLNDTIRSLAVAADGRIYVGGELTTYNGVAVTNIVRFNPDGTLDASFLPVILPAGNFANGIQKILPLPDGRVVVSGYFSSVNGIARNEIVGFKPDGTVATNWFPAGGLPFAGNSVYGLAWNGTDVLVGGNFFTFEGLTRRYLVAVGTNGVVNTNFNHTLNNVVGELETQPGGAVWALGSFTHYTNGLPYPAVKPTRIYGDGVVVGNSATNLTNPSKLLAQANGALIVGFNNGTNRLLRLNADGSVDGSFETMSGFNSSVNDLAMTPDGSLYVAGFFSTVAGVPYRSLVRLYSGITNLIPDSPLITLHPANTVVAAGSNGVLRAAATGTAPLTFSWLKDGLPVSGATGARLVLTNFTALEAGAYQLIASNGSGSVTSSVANVTLAVVPAITQQPPPFTGATNGGMVALTVGVSGSTPLFFQWYKDSSLMHGLTNNPYTISNLAAGNTGNWFMVVSNLYGRATSSIVNVQIGTLPSVFTQPNNQTLNGTGNVSMVAGVSGSTPLAYQWFRNGSPVAGLITNAFTISNAVPTNAGSYYLVVTNFVGSVTSLTRTVTINNPYLAANSGNRSVPIGGTTNLAVSVTGTEPITYFWYQRRFSPNLTNFISAGSSSNLTFVNAARTNDGSYFVVASNVWGTVTSSLAWLTVDFPPAITNIIPGTNVVAEVNSFVYIPIGYEGSPTPAFRWFKDGVYQPSLPDRYYLQFVSAQTNHSGTYQVVLSNYLGSVTSAPILLTVLPPRPPTITNQPGNRVVAVNGQLNLTVGADGSPTMYYALFKQGGSQIGVWTSSSYLSATMTSTNNSGSYYIVVTNNYGRATSELASVTVVQPQPATFNGKQFVKIADSVTVVPGLTPARFYGGFRDAFIRGNQVWFGGMISGVPYSIGVYHWSNQLLTKLVDTNSLVPGSTSHFTNFYGSTFLSASRVVFVGYGSGMEHGIYAWTNGSITKIYDQNNLMPGRADQFERFGWPTVVGNQFAFLGFQSYGNTNFDDDYRAVYISSNNILTKIADTNDTLPQLGGNFRGSSSQVGFDGTNVAWWAWNVSDLTGIFRAATPAALTNLADEATLNPASGLNFDGFISPPSVFNGRTYLVGHDENFNSSLFYRDPAGPLTLIAKPGDTVPARGMSFDSVAYPAQASSAAGVFFDGSDGAGYYGINFWNGTNIVKVVDSLDTLDGQAISYLYTADAENDNLVFYVNFMNGRTALYALMSPGQTFNQWATQYPLPPAANQPSDDADTDGILNIFEYYFGSNPTNAASGAQPTIVSVNVSGLNYPAITFIRSQNVSGVNLLPQVSSTLTFSNSLGLTVVAVVDLGNGTERVTIRSNVSMGAQVTQFLRIRLSMP